MLTSMIFSALFFISDPSFAYPCYYPCCRRYCFLLTGCSAIGVNGLSTSTHLSSYMDPSPNLAFLCRNLDCKPYSINQSILHGSFESIVNALPLPRIDMYTVVQQIFISLVASFMCPLTPETLPTCHLHDVRHGFYNLLLVHPGTDCEF